MAPPPQLGHTTWRFAREPSVGVLWTYADVSGDGFRRLGGGTYDPATDTYGQGAFNADDIFSRARRRLPAALARDGLRAQPAGGAYALLRGLTYLQTATGPNAGNVVLWMQPDGTLNPSAEPVELPEPSDSGPSYGWRARCGRWARATARSRSEDRAFARFLPQRLVPRDRRGRSAGRWSVTASI